VIITALSYIHVNIRTKLENTTDLLSITIKEIKELQNTFNRINGSKADAVE
jgi:hypothetical protein